MGPRYLNFVFGFGSGFWVLEISKNQGFGSGSKTGSGRVFISEKLFIINWLTFCIFLNKFWLTLMKLFHKKTKNNWNSDQWKTIKYSPLKSTGKTFKMRAGYRPKWVLIPINNLRLCLVLGCFRNVLGTFYKEVLKNLS